MFAMVAYDVTQYRYLSIPLVISSCRREFYKIGVNVVLYTNMTAAG